VPRRRYGAAGPADVRVLSTFPPNRVLRYRYRLGERGWEELLDKFESLERRGAIVGEGRAKTALLEDLLGRLSGRGFRFRGVALLPGERRLDDQQRETLFARLQSGDLLWIDGADALSRLSWLRVRRESRAAAGLLVTSDREGLLPTLYRRTADADVLSEIVREATGAGTERFGYRAEDLMRRHNGSVREALRELSKISARLARGFRAPDEREDFPGR
jgi:hypothetical protein